MLKAYHAQFVHPFVRTYSVIDVNPKVMAVADSELVGTFAARS